MIKNVCVFASSSNKLDEEFYSDASELGQLLGAHGMNIVYGGSRLGAMYACAIFGTILFLNTESLLFTKRFKAISIYIKAKDIFTPYIGACRTVNIIH